MDGSLRAVFGTGAARFARGFLLSVFAMLLAGFSAQSLAACGGPGQRACCVGEKSFGACSSGLSEKGSCANELGAKNCGCGDNPNNLFKSIGVCRATKVAESVACGGPGQRGCCIGADRAENKISGPCKAGLFENNSPGCEKALGKNKCLCGAVGPITSTGVCQAQSAACGKENGPPCKLDAQIVQGRKSCDAGLVEDFGVNKCVKLGQLSCGKLNQRACTIFERVPSCDPGLGERFTRNGGQCVPAAQSDLQKVADLFKSIAGNNAMCFEKVAGFAVDLVKTQGSYMFDPKGFGADLKRNNVQAVASRFNASLAKIPAECKTSFKGLSLSVTADGGLVAGVSGELGVAFNLTGKGTPVRVYRTASANVGLISGGGGAVNVGLMTSVPDDMTGEGMSFSASGGPKAVSVGASVGFNPDPPTATSGTTYVIDIAHFAGIAFSVGVGASIVPVDVRTSWSLTELAYSPTDWRSADRNLCGKLNNRPCLIIERVPSCDPGLVEDFIWHSCVKPGTGSILLFSGR